MDVQIKKETEETAKIGRQDDEKTLEDSRANNKRPRLFAEEQQEPLGGDDGGKTDDVDVPDQIVSFSTTTTVTPSRNPAAVSATILTEQQSTVSSVGTNPDDASGSVPTFATIPTTFQLSMELCKLVDTNKYSLNGDSLPTLKRIGKWAELAKNSGENTFFESLLLYGALPRVVDFLRHNVNDVRCTSMAAQVLSRCVVIASAENAVLGGLLVDGIVGSQGIRALLLASDTYSTSDNDTPLFQIWSGLRKLLALESTRYSMGWSEQAQVVDCALHCLEKQKDSGISSENVTAKILGTMDVIVLGNPIKYIKKLKGKNFVVRCLESIRREVGPDDNSSIWIGDEASIASSLLMIVKCCEKKAQMLQSVDFLKIIPFCVFAMQKFPNTPDIHDYCMILLSKASKESNDKAIESSVLGATVTLLKDDGLSESVKEEARQLIRGMYD
jgi:hypothetical protein